MHELIKLLAEVRPLRDPVLLASFAGRGGSSATAAVQYLVDHWHALPVAEIDEQESFDFTVRRPHVRIEHGERMLTWPSNKIYVASPTILGTPRSSARDFILLPGMDPHLRWQSFCDAVTDLAKALGCTSAVVLGSRAGSVPHTRPVPFRLTTTDPEFTRLFDQQELTVPNYEGPTGLQTVIALHLQAAGLRVASLSAMTPFYLSLDPNPQAISAIAQAIDGAFGTATGLEDLDAELSEVDTAAEDALQESPQLRAAVASMEQQIDWTRGAQPKPGAEPAATELPAGSEVVAELEQFLREQRGGGTSSSS